MAKGKRGNGGAAQPGSVKPNMHKMYDGMNVATRPIPIIHDSEDDRAIAAASSSQKPKDYAVNLPSGPRPAGTEIVTGSTVGGKTVGGARAGVYNPAQGLGQHTA